jgi:hypothetical protein
MTTGKPSTAESVYVRLTQTIMTIIRPRFIALDSSQLGDLARDSQAGDRSRRDAVSDFLASFAANGCVLLLCWHHFEELLRHRNRDVVGKRISFFRSLDLVAWIKSAQDDPSPGGIVDILAFEADQAFKDAKADPATIRDRVLPNLIRCGGGREVIAPFAANLDRLQPSFWQREQHEREVIAIARSSTIDFGNTNVMDWWKGRWRSLDDAHRRLSAMARLLGEDIRQRGDERISEPATVAAEFFAGVRERAETGQIEGNHLSEAALLPEHIERSEIGPDTTLNEMADLSMFRKRLRLANEYLGAPWPELKRRVTEKHLPSALIQSILRDYVQDPPRRKGSELTDRHLACLAPYADRTYVDKRTHEAVVRARRKFPQFASMARSIEKASGYTEIGRRVNEALRRPA